MRAAILRACTGVTRSSLVAVTKNTGGYFPSLLTFWYGEYFRIQSRSAGRGGAPYGARVHLRHRRGRAGPGLRARREIRNAGAVGGDGKELLGQQVRSIEAGRQRLDRHRLSCGAIGIERGRGGVALEAQVRLSPPGVR